MIFEKNISYPKDSSEEQRQKKQRKGMVNKMGERILVVDDDREIVKAIDILLKKEGYEVLKAYDGLQALDVQIGRASCRERV